MLSGTQAVFICIFGLTYAFCCFVEVVFYFGVF